MERHNNKRQNLEKRIIIAERDNIAAVMENGRVSDFIISRGDVILGDVYLATVDNILPSIDAAFVNVGTDKMGFLHAQDVMGKGALKDKLSPKQKLIVQVVKEPTGHKGPRVTTEISLPGRFLVLMPNEPGISISKKIENNKERARLKSVVSLIKPVGVGVIIRTEAEGQSEADIQEDLEILLEKWNNIITSAETLTPPNLLYRDQDLLYRTIREACTEDVKEIVVDTVKKVESGSIHLEKTDNFKKSQRFISVDIPYTSSYPSNLTIKEATIMMNQDLFVEGTIVRNNKTKETMFYLKSDYPGIIFNSGNAIVATNGKQYDREMRKRNGIGLAIGPSLGVYYDNPSHSFKPAFGISLTIGFTYTPKILQW